MASQRIDEERLQAAAVPYLDKKVDLIERSDDERQGVPAFRRPEAASDDPLEFAHRVMEAALRNATSSQLLAELQRRHGGGSEA